VALGSDGLLPAAFARHSPRSRTPVLAILVTTAASLFGALFCVVPGLGGERAFERLTNLSNLAVLVQYATTCLAVIALRAHQPAGPLGFRLPGGRFAIPLLGLLACAFLLRLVFEDERWPEQFAVFLAWIALGLLLALLARTAARAGAARRRLSA
jgi:APA family basic amino acid/polyamine antiporter